VEKVQEKYLMENCEERIKSMQLEKNLLRENCDLRLVKVINLI